ncbi:MAG: hypothetical protein SCK70_09005 [bacterium]|nr:hypothetical protein [bacterium]
MFCLNSPVTIAILIAISFLCSCTSSQPAAVIQNPYANVDWLNHGRYKANFHTHTTVSDGQANPHEVVDHYQRLGYKVLALTDHNAVTYPWENFSGLKPSNLSKQRLNNGALETDQLIYEDRNPVQMDMIAIQGNELSSHHHMGSFFIDHNFTQTEQASLDSTAAKNGLTALFHPGRYQHPLEWYTDLYQRYDHLIGQEIYNQGDRYPNDRNTWDAILSEMMPERPVWGFSNDDMHSPKAHLGRNWNIMLLPELSPEWVRRGMEQGLFFFVYAPKGHNGPHPPAIDSITVDSSRGLIRIHGSGYELIEWIAGGKVVHQGEQITSTNLPLNSSYVRAVLYGTNGNPILGTQPFSIKRNKR